MFPLLSLPKDAILETIRVMDIERIICLSLVSKRCKAHVISLNMKATSFEVSILGDVNIDIVTSTTDFYLEFPSDETVMAGQKRKLKIPDSFTVCLHEEDFIIDLGQWKWTSFEYQDWLEHLWDIFHCQGIKQLHFNDDSFLYDLDDIKNVFGKAEELYVEHTGCYDFNQLIFQKFGYIEKIRFDISVLPEYLKFYSNVLIRNINQLHIMGFNKTFKLNDLLIINSKSIEINDLQFPPRAMNTFIKLWLKGSNPRLEYLQIEYSTDDAPDQDEVMKGIKYKKVSRDHSRQFKSCCNESTVKGGMDIQRKDGTRATIQISQAGTRHSFEMFIWHDHCFVRNEELKKFMQYLGERIARAKLLFNGNVVDFEL